MPGKITQKAGVRISSQIGGFCEYLPDGYNPRKQYPVFILVHGQGEIGAGTAASLPKVLNNLPARLARDNKFPVEAIVIIPQTTSAVSDATTIALIDYVTDNYPALGGKVVTQGLSLGGNFPMKAAILRPDKVWAAVPMSAAYDITAVNAAKVAATKIQSLWFHGTKDGTIGIGKTRSNVKKLLDAGALVTAVYFEGVGHDSWSPATTYKNENGLTWIEWAVSLMKVKPEEPPVENPDPVYDSYSAKVSPILTLKEPYRLNGSKGKFITAQFGPQSVSPASPATNPATYTGPRYAAFSQNGKKAQLVLSSLETGLKYDVVLFSSRAANVMETTRYESQGQVSGDIRTYNNVSEPYTLKDLVPGTDGRIVIDFIPGKSYTYLSEIKVTEKS